MGNTVPPKQDSPGNRSCPSCGALNSDHAVRCVSCGVVLRGTGTAQGVGGGPTVPIGGKTRVLASTASGGAGSRGHLVAPKALDLGSLRAGETARGKLRIANNGGALLTGTARTGPDTPWLHVLSDTVYCAAGAVEALDVQVDTSGLRAGRHAGAVILDTDGGRATVQVNVQVFRDSLWPALAAGLATAITLLAIAGLIYATTGGKLPLAASATTTPTQSPSSTPSLVPTWSPTSLPTATFTFVPTITPTPVDIGATATALALQAQQMVADNRATATALAVAVAATDTAVAAEVANQAPGATEERLAIKAAVNDFLLVRAKALNTVDDSALPSVAYGKELSFLRNEITTLRTSGVHTKIISLDPPLWDAIDLHGPDSADATLSKHEDEMAIHTATGLADTTLSQRDLRFGVTYHVVLINGHWLVVDHTVYGVGTAQPTPRPDLLPPPGSALDTGAGTATALPTVAPSPGGLNIEDVVKQTLPSVLRVTGDVGTNQQSTGTGFVIATSGTYAFVVTNDHVVSGANNVTVSNGYAGQLPALSVQEDSADDLAVIKVAQPATPLPALTWGDSSSAQLGENVVAIGFALGLQGEPSVTNGILSALHRDVGQPWLYLQHTAPINHGNSGGPLLDLGGKVIGINTLLDENAQSVYFAIPASKAQKKVAELMSAMPNP